LTKNKQQMDKLGQTHTSINKKISTEQLKSK